jgi:ABC-type transporter Mla maintaining outer membrane lipid asymmetry ATPase subunit MlaF
LLRGSYLKTFPKGKNIADTSHPDQSIYPIEDHVKTLKKQSQMTCFWSAHDLVTRRSVTGILFILYNIPVRWISKYQKTAEISTYSSELVGSKMLTELKVEFYSCFGH